MNQPSNLETQILKLVGDAGLTPNEQGKLFNRLVKRISSHGDATILKPAGRKALSVSHKKRTYLAWCKKRLDEKHARQAVDGIHRNKVGRPIKNLD